MGQHCGPSESSDYGLWTFRFESLNDVRAPNIDRPKLITGKSPSDSIAIFKRKPKARSSAIATVD